MRNKTFSNEQLQSDRIVPITNSCEWQKHPLYQIFRILLPIFPSLARLRGGAGHPDWVESARRRGQPRQRPPHRLPWPGAPRLGRAPGSEIPRPIIPHIISLSRGQQIPINLRSKLFPILDQSTSGVWRGGAGRANRPDPSPVCSSSSIPSHRACNGPDPIFPLSSRVAPSTPKSGSQKPHPHLSYYTVATHKEWEVGAQRSGGGPNLEGRVVLVRARKQGWRPGMATHNVGSFLILIFEDLSVLFCKMGIGRC